MSNTICVKDFCRLSYEVFQSEQYSIIDFSLCPSVEARGYTRKHNYERRKQCIEKPISIRQ